MARPDSTPDAQAAYSKIVNAADKIFAAVEDLEQAGGMAALAAGWTPKARERAAGVLKSARGARRPDRWAEGGGEGDDASD